ncbi:MAG: glycosyltransferase family 2 protein [Roseiarcus sp.]
MNSESTAIAGSFESSPQRQGMTRQRAIIDEPHHQSLELLAAHALAEGDGATAFMFADRRCRIAPPPEAHCYVLRAEAAHQMGDRVGALGDIARALELAPDDVAANRRMLVWAEGGQRSNAAKALIGGDADPGVLRNAIKILQADGQTIAAKVTALDSRVEGWAVWRDEAPLEVAIADEAGCVAALFERDPLHPFADLGHAARFALTRPRSPTPQSIMLSVAGRIFHSLRAPPNERPARRQPARPAPDPAGEPSASVIVPVHGDFEATRACLESLFVALDGSPRHRALIVNDATPDPCIAAYLATLRSRPRVELLTNPLNLGFVGSINRALAHVEYGDVILLNADTLVPPGFIDRLASAAHSSPDIGAVTPLSNHGEFASFPTPNAFNPLEPPGEIQRIDKAAAASNRGRVVDLPSGIGFCLYVTRACLDAVGSLSEDFHRGYLEDVDFCLRARERGFRSVCAASVYVGHAGSKSFGQDKRALVVRNLKVLERRYPGHRSECAAFLLADPLRTARQSIERAIAPAARRPRLLVCGAGVVGAVARARAERHAAPRRPAMILEARRVAGGEKVRIFNPAGGAPQSLQFDLAVSRERSALVAYLRALRSSRIEFLDPGGAPVSLLKRLLELEVPYDLFIADAGLLDRGGGPVTTFPLRRSRRDAGPDGAPAEPPHVAARWRSGWRIIAENAERILAPCERAQAFAATILPGRKISRLDSRADQRRSAGRSGGNGETGRLGVVAVRSCAQEQRQIVEIARAFRARRPEISITVLGATLDDLGLMRIGDVFVTGRVEVAEFERLIGASRLDALFLGLTEPLFGHPIVSLTHNARLPVAYRDWSAGVVEPRKGDLPIPARAPLDAVIDNLAQWLARP